jgi:hypothetical protein
MQTQSLKYTTYDRKYSGLTWPEYNRTLPELKRISTNPERDVRNACSPSFYKGANNER